MNRFKLQLMMGEALRSAGASEEILAVMQNVLEECLKPGRPRVYANRTEKQRAYRARRKQREKDFTAAPRVLTRVLKGLLVDAASANVDREADVAPILALIDQGCDLFFASSGTSECFNHLKLQLEARH
jgi:hypothetical protein